MNTDKLKMGALIAVVAAGGLYFLYVKSGLKEKAENFSMSGVTDKVESLKQVLTDATSPAAAPTAKPSAPPPVASAKSAATVKSAAVRFATPDAGDRWAIDTQHEIAWNVRAGALGALELLDAASKKRIGWILPSVDDDQTSFAWDTRDVSVTRRGGTRQILVPGTYFVRLAFDDGRAAVESASITLVLPGMPEIVTAVVRLANSSVTPKVLTVKRGGVILFINGEKVPQRLSSGAFSPFSIASGEISRFETAKINLGTYNYYTDVYTYRAPGTLIVE